MFDNLKRFGTITEMKTINSRYSDYDGIRLTMENEKDATSQNVYIILGFNQDWYEVQLPNGSYDCVVCYVDAKSEQDALDKAVDFLYDAEIAFDFCDFYDAQDNDMVDENGNVIDSICCGNEGIYVPCTVIIKKEN